MFATSPWLPQLQRQVNPSGTHRWPAGLCQLQYGFQRNLVDTLSVGGDRIQRNFEPQYSEFSARIMWSLSNAFTSAFKKLDPVPQFKATAKLGGFLAQLPN